MKNLKILVLVAMVCALNINCSKKEEAISQNKNSAAKVLAANNAAKVMPNNRAYAYSKNGHLVLEFASYNDHPQVQGKIFRMDGELTLSKQVTDELGLPDGYTIAKGNYPIIIGPGGEKIVEF